MDKIEVEASSTNATLKELLSTLNSINSSLTGIGNNNGLKNTEKRAKDVASTIKSALNFGAVIAVGKKALNYMNECWKAGNDLTETVNLFNVALGKGVEGENEYYEKAIRFQEELTDKLGVNINESMRYQAVFNSMSKSIGMTSDVAEKLSENFTKLGYDLSSLYNVDTTKAMNKLQSALSGQTKPLRDFGIDITQSTLAITALNHGITEEVSDMNQAEKMLLRYISILDQSKLSHGDFANTITSSANQLRIFSAQVTALKQNIGNMWNGIVAKWLPYINAILMVINEVIKAIGSLFGFQMNVSQISVGGGMGADLADNTGAAANNLDKANKKAKELKLTLQSFDEIHNFETDKDDSSGSGGSGGGGAGGVGGINQGLLDAMQEYDNLMSNIQNKANDIRDKIMDWLGFDKLINEETGEIEWKLRDGITNLIKIRDIAIAIGSALLAWKVARPITKLLENLGVLRAKQAFKIAFGVTLLVAGISLIINGVKHMLNGDITPFSIGETILGALFAGGGTYMALSSLGITIPLALGLEGATAVIATISGIGAIIAGVVASFLSIKRIIEETEFSLGNLAGALSGVALIAVGVGVIFGGIPALVTAIVGILTVAVVEIVKHFDIIKEKFGGIITFVTDFVSGIAETVYNLVIVPVIEFFTPILEAIGNVFSTIISNIADIVVNIATNIKLIIEKIVEIIAKVIEVAKAIFKAVYDYAFKPIFEKIVEMWNTVQSKFITPFLQWCKKIHDTLWELFGAFGQKVVDFIGGILKGVVNAIFERIESNINGFIRLLNGAINIINKIPEVNISAVSELSLPRLADGGYVGAGELFIAREAGPELVGTIGGHTAVANNDQIVSAVSRGVYEAVASAMAQYGGNTTNIYADVDSGIIFKKMQKEERNYRKQTGKPAFSGI